MICMVRFRSIVSNAYACVDIAAGHDTSISTSRKIKIKNGDGTVTTAKWITLTAADIDNLTPSAVGLTLEKGGVCTIYTTQTLSLQDFDVWFSPQIVPCRRIWDANGNEVKAVISVRSS